jgi:hypothetical protein
LKTLFGQVVFSVGKAEYCWEDVVLAAELWGDWVRLRERVREGVACLKRAEDEATPLSAEEIESAADEFRYARDLVAAEEMEEWLERWGLTAESWMDSIRSTLLRKKWSDKLADLVSEESPTDEDVDARIQTEAVCSGELERLAFELAGRTAIHDGEEKEGSKGPGSETDVAAIFEQFPSGLRGRGLPGISLDASRAKMERLARLEASYRRFCERAVTPEAVAAQIRSYQTDWTRLECDSVSFPELQAAREAALCVREDGGTLDHVAGDANREVRREQVYIEETEPDFRDQFLGAQKGELIGPVSRGDEFVLCLVREKVLPSGNDPRIAARAEEAVVQRFVEREVNDRVKWRVQF